MSTNESAPFEGKERSDITRRSFIRFGAAATLALTAGTSMATLFGCKSPEGDALILGKQTIIDDVGREVTIPVPDRLERVYFTSALAQVFCYTLNPSLLGGITAQFSDARLEYLVDGIADLPYMGALSSGGQIDREALLAEDIQLIFSISAIEITEANIEDAETLQAQTGIPCVLIDGSFDKIANAYRLLGTCMGSKERADSIAAYLEEVLDGVTEVVSQIPEDERVSFYYAEGPLGLQSESTASQQALVFEVAGGRNVFEGIENTGMLDVSMEQVLHWNPEIIIATDSKNVGGADELIRTSSLWDSVPAVKNERVYTMPYAPFAWVDRPPAVNRFLGLQWLTNMFYPNKYDVDMVEVAKDFYSRLYWVEITDEQAIGMLGNSYPPYRGAAS